MLKRGAEGATVFEPAFLPIARGATVKFLASGPGHDAESIGGMIPEGSASLVGKINEEIEVTLETGGLRRHMSAALPDAAV